MKRSLSFVALFASLVLIATTAGAQWPAENHYKVYTLQPPATFAGSLVLADQFGIYQISAITLDRFATPVEKNGEPIIEPLLHQTWWRLDIPTVGWFVELGNQFGEQGWQIGDLRYLVAPARKYEPGPPLPYNHYLAYDATGPDVAVPVHLVDQFGAVDVVALRPLYFLNPAEKQVDGVVYPIIDPEAHLACYELDPIMTYGILVTAFDQFGTWEFTIQNHECLCVPSVKHGVVATEDRTWGEIKSLYR